MKKRYLSIAFLIPFIFTACSNMTESVSKIGDRYAFFGINSSIEGVSQVISTSADEEDELTITMDTGEEKTCFARLYLSAGSSSTTVSSVSFTIQDSRTQGTTKIYSYDYVSGSYEDEYSLTQSYYEKDVTDSSYTQGEISVDIGESCDGVALLFCSTGMDDGKQTIKLSNICLYNSKGTAISWNRVKN